MEAYQELGGFNLEIKSSGGKAIRYLALVVFIAVVNMVMLCLDGSGMAGVFAIWGITVVCLLYTKLNIFHPLSWFSVVFSLYYTAYALLILVYGKSSYGLTGESLRYSTIALSTIIIVCAFPNNEKYYNRYTYRYLKTNDFGRKDFFILERCLIVGMAVAFALTAIVSRSFVSKAMSTKGSLFGICTYLIRALTFLCGVYILATDENKKAKKTIIIVCGVLCIMFGFLNAERDCILRFILVVLITLFFKNIISKNQLLVLAPIGVVAMVLINYLKYFFIDGSVGKMSGGLIQSFLSSDFGAPGGNLQNLVNHNMAGFAGYKTIATDIIRGTIPNIRVGVNYKTWYNDYFFRGSSYNRAFTLVGEGYLIGGSIGIIVLFSIVAIIIVLLSKRNQKSVWSLMTYVYGIVTIVSCFRGSLIDIVTGLIRVPLMAILLFLLFQGIYMRGIIRIKL